MDRRETERKKTRWTLWSATRTGCVGWGLAGIDLQGLSAFSGDEVDDEKKTEKTNAGRPENGDWRVVLVRWTTPLAKSLVSSCVNGY